MLILSPWHTFVTGSTGSGKSNTVYELLNQLHSIYGTHFLVVEPAKWRI
ncbi:MAG: helicase HerA domain-containing protein [Enterocloster sp.]